MPHSMRLDAAQIDTAFATALQRASQVLADGGLVLFPTETFYGLAVDPAHERALSRLQRIKDRMAHKPVPLIAANQAACDRLGPTPQVLQELCTTFWPGPLTVAIEPYATWSPILLGGGKTLGVRVSSHPVAAALAQAAGGLITSTSANLANQPAAASLDAVDPHLVSEVDLMLDAGTLPGGRPSTVIFARGDDVVLVRAGAISERTLERALGRPLVIL